MKRIIRIKNLFIILLGLLSTPVEAQMGCFTPSLGVYDNTTGAPLSAALSCTYTNFIRIRPTSYFSGSNAISPCMQLRLGPTNANSATNNSLTMFQGTTTIVSLCSSTPAPCWTIVPNSTNYSLSAAAMDPTLPHSFSLCNIAAAGAFGYTVTSCYSSATLATGTWSNASPNFCQSFTVPANSPIGTNGYTIAPGIPSTGSLVTPSGLLILDTYQMAAGIYTITYFFDSQGSCTSTATRTISISNPFNAGWTNLTPQCTYNSCSTLSVQVTGTPGGGFSGPGVTTGSFCPATAGVGSHTVMYAVGINSICGASFINTIVVAPTPTANAGVTQSLTCANNPTVLAGSGGGTYSWSHSTYGNNFTTTATPSVGITGTYSLTVSNGTCTSPVSTVNVANNTTPPSFPSISVSNVINCLPSNTSAVISATGSNLTYTWSGPGIIAGGNTSSPTVNIGGAYNYTITSTINGCTATSVVAVSSNTSANVNLSTSAAINCTNNVTSISANQPTYSYTWTAPSTSTLNSGQSTPTINITGTGIYTIMVFNPANGCTFQTTYVPTTNTTVITPNISNLGVDPITCSSPTSVLNGTPGSGVTYTWATSNGSIITSVSNQSIGIGAGGIYTLSVTNATNACIGTQTISIGTNTTPPSALNINPNNVILACPAQTAIITATSTGATSYNWIAPGGGSILSGGSTATAQVTSSSPAVFTVIATAANGCTSTQVATVSPNTNAPTFTLSNNSPSITCNSATPMVTVGITSTVGISGYNWSPSSGISGPTNSASVTFTAPGSYTCVVTATNGCLTSAIVPVGTATTPPTVAAGSGTAANISCTNSLVAIVPTFTPSSSNYTYTWSGPGIVGSANGSSVAVNQPGSYSVVITDTVTGCSTSSIVIPVNGTITAPSLNVASTSTAGIGCLATNSVITLTANSTPTYNFNWSTGATTPTISVTTPGVYTVTVTDPSSGCSATQTVDVINNTVVPGFTATAVGALPCGSTSGTVQLNASSSGTNVSYSWSGTSIVSGSNTSSPIVDQAGIYTVLVTDNESGCSGTATVGVINPTVIASFTANVNSGAVPLSIDFTNNSSGATTYTWSFGDSGNSTSTSTNPTFVYDAAGNYTIILTASNGLCNDTYTLEIKASGSFTVPELFSPNGDT
ncbi:MAG: beta strand repeat-containing protein, partial [Bacteroidia bacterium]